MFSSVVILFLILLSAVKVYSIPQYEFDALTAFYASTNGDNWVNSWNFTNVTASNFCPGRQWIWNASLFCSEADPGATIQGLVFLYFNNLDGTIPDSLGNLTNLQLLFLKHQPNLHGSIPETVFSQTPYIIGLSLWNISISGEISQLISNWNYLQLLGIANTNLSGTLPVSMYSSFVNVYSFMVLENPYLSVELNDNICEMIAIQTFQISGNGNLFGTFPGNCVGNWTLLETFILIGSREEVGYDNELELNGTITDSITQLIHLSQFQVSNTSIDGNILGFSNYTSWYNVSFFYISNNSFSGSINSALCDSSILTIPHVLYGYPFHMFDISYNNFDGAIPHCFWERIFNASLKLSPTYMILINLQYNQFSGQISNDNITTCKGWFDNSVNNTCYGILTFGASHNKFSGTLTQQLTTIPMFQFSASNNKLSGSMPHGWNVLWFSVQDNDFSGSIKDNFINPYTFNSLGYDKSLLVRLDGNKFISSIPTSLINLKDLITIQLSRNKFDRLPKNVSNPTLVGFYASNNDIVENDIGDYLTRFINKNPRISQISLSHNRGITGDISNFVLNDNNNNETNVTSGKHLTHLWLHVCDIYGKFSDSMRITSDKFESFFFFDNRGSCDLPHNWITMSNNTANNTINSLVIPGNKFTKNRNVAWINPDFSKDVPMVIVTDLDDTTMKIAVGFTVFALCLIIIFCAKSVHAKRKNKNTLKNQNNQMERLSNGENNNENDNKGANMKNGLLSLIDSIFKMFFNIGTFLLIFILTIIYYFCSYYFECGVFISHFTLTYFYSDSLFATVALCFGVVILNGILLWHLWKLSKTTDNISNEKSEIEMDDMSSDADSESYNVKDTCLCIKTFGTFLIWTIIYVILLIIITFSIILDYIPNNNTILSLLDNKTFKQGLKYCIVLILIVNSMFVIPNMVRSFVHFCWFKTNYKNNNNNYNNIDSNNSNCINKTTIYLICLFRSISSTILPLTVSIALLNNCGKQWTTLWKECANNNDSFNFSATFSFDYIILELFEQTISSEEVIMTHSEVCSFNWDDFALSSCLQEFLDFWIPIITLKTITLIFIVNPLKLLSKVYGQSVSSYCKKCIPINSFKNNSDGVKKSDGAINVESQYATWIGGIENCIVFCSIAPYLLILGAMFMLCNMFIIKLLIKKYQFKINDNFTHFPSYFLFCQIIAQQVLFLTVCWNMFPLYAWIWYTDIVLFVVIDIAWVVLKHFVK